MLRILTAKENAPQRRCGMLTLSTIPLEHFAMKWIKVTGQVATVVNAAHIVRIYGSNGKFKVELINGESFDIAQAESDRLVKLLMEEAG